MKRTTVAAHGVTGLSCFAASLAIAAMATFAFRSGGVASVVPLLVCSGFGIGLSLARASRRAKTRAPHRLVVRRGVWLIVVSCLATFVVSQLLAVPSVLLWVVCGLCGAGVFTVLSVAQRLGTNRVAVTAAAGAVLGVLAVFVLSQVNLRPAIDTAARGNGVTAAQLANFPKSISLSEAKNLADDPRTGFLGGSLSAARTRTIRSQLAGSLQFALILGFVGLLTSLVLPRRLKSLKELV
jgi:hypothetical protein